MKVEDLTVEETALIEGLMKTDGKWRFLERDEHLTDLVRQDSDTLNKMNISHKQIAYRLKSLIDPFHYQCFTKKLELGQDVLELERRGTFVEDRYFVSVTEQSITEGQPCYFEIINEPLNIDTLEQTARDAGMDEQTSKAWALITMRRQLEYHGSSVYRIEDRRKRLFSRSAIEFPEVMIHLIGSHCFFGGKKTPLRLEPDAVTHFFGLEPGKDYRLKAPSITLWQQRGSISSLSADYLSSKQIMKNGKRISLQEGVTVYVEGKKGMIWSKKHVKLKQPLKIDGFFVDLYRNEIEPGQTLIHLEKLSFDVGYI